MAVITIFAFVFLTTFASELLTTGSSCDAPRAWGLINNIGLVHHLV